MMGYVAAVNFTMPRFGLRQFVTYGCGALALFSLNACIYWKLYFSHYPGVMDPVEASQLAISRLLTNHQGLGQWVPLWFGGVPLVDAGGLLLPACAAWISGVTGWPGPQALHFLSALLSCAVPVALFAICLSVTRQASHALVAGLLSSLVLGYHTGPHLAAVGLIPVFLLLLHVAAARLRWWAIGLAPFTVAAVFATDLTAAAGLIAAATAFVLAGRGRRWLMTAGIVVLGYLLACPWVPLSALSRARENLPWTDPAFSAHGSFYGWLIIIAGLLALYLLLKTFRTGPWLRFLAYDLLITGVACIAHVIPQSRLLFAEFNLAACALAACGMKWVYGRTRSPIRQVLAVCFGLICVVQIVVVRHHVHESLRPIDLAQSHEYRLSKWLETSLPGQRVLVAGGCCRQAVPNQQYLDAEWAILTGQNAGSSDAENAITWLKAYGFDAVVVTPDFWKPHKFDGILPVLWRDENATVYDVQRRSPVLAHVVPQRQVIAYAPESGLDVEVIKPYVGAIESASAPVASLHWISPSRAYVEADVGSGERVSVQIANHTGWLASVAGKPVPIYPDGLGLMLIHPPGAGHWKIDLVWDGDQAAAISWQIGGLCALVLWVFAAAVEIKLPVLRLRRWMVGAGIAAIFVTLLVRSAWVSEDAYISFRVADNLFAGYGLRWNIADRVQTYTDPLYLALVTMAAKVSGEFYVTCIVMSLLITLAAIFLIAHGTAPKSLTVAVLALLFSKGFIDYSVSGLENPATHLAIAGYLFVYCRRNRDPFLLSLMAALAVTNRQDTLLFFLPSLCLVYFRAGRKVWKPALAGWFPFMLWSLFSLFYYGFVFPNTAYAKLNTGIPVRDLIQHGAQYFLNAWHWDTGTAVVVIAGIVVACVAKEWMLAAGILLNLLYVLRVGGDYMTSRFFTGALFMSAAILARYWKFSTPVTIAAAAMVVAAGMTIPAPTITSARLDFGKPWPQDPGTFIFDARAWTYPCSGLLRYREYLPIWPGHLVRSNSIYSLGCSYPPVPNSSPRLWPDAFVSRTGEILSRAGKSVGIYSGVGMIGFFGGPDAHLIDDMGLGDALIARLPAKRNDWQIGHFRRAVPTGYLETIKTGLNQIADPGLHEYYDHMKIVISGDLWSKQRLKEIVLFNLGHYDSLLDAYSKAAKGAH